MEITISSPWRMRVTSTPVKSSASPAIRTPCGKRNASAYGCVFLSAGSAAATEP